MDLHRTKSNNFFYTSMFFSFIWANVRRLSKKTEIELGRKKTRLFPSTLMACHCLTHSNANYGNHFFFFISLAVFHIKSVHHDGNAKRSQLDYYYRFIIKSGPKKSERAVRCFRLYLFGEHQMVELMMSKREKNNTLEMLHVTNYPEIEIGKSFAMCVWVSCVVHI